MYTVIHKYDVKLSHEKVFYSSWRIFSKELETKHNSIGSSLHYSDGGAFFAITYWRSQDDWSKFWLLKDQTIEALTEMRACLKSETKLDAMQLLSTDLSFGRGNGAAIRDQEFLKLIEQRKQNLNQSTGIDSRSGVESVNHYEIDFDSLNEDTIVLEDEVDD